MKESEYDVLMFNASLKDEDRKVAKKRLSRMRKKRLWKKIVTNMNFIYLSKNN